MPICSLVRTRKRASVFQDIEAARPDPDAFAGAFSQAAAPARYMVERGDWTGAANLEVKPSKFPHAMAITYFARAVGAARSGNTDAAKADAAKLAELRDRLREAKNNYWAGQVDVQQQIATAWVLYADGKQDEALKVMSAAVDAEDKTEKAPVTPGPLAPARELYGLHAARSRHGQGGARGVRGHDGEGAKPLQRLCRRGQGSAGLGRCG